MPTAEKLAQKRIEAINELEKIAINGYFSVSLADISNKPGSNEIQIILQDTDENNSIQMKNSEHQDINASEDVSQAVGSKIGSVERVHAEFRSMLGFESPSDETKKKWEKEDQENLRSTIRKNLQLNHIKNSDHK